MSTASWSQAASFEDLCELGARFVEGRLHSFPGWGAAELDEESVPLVPLLARLNRAGILTLASQPGRARAARAAEQRAFASGFCRRSSARRCARLAPRGLRVRCFAPTDSGRARVAVTREHGIGRVFAGHNAFAEELTLFEGRIGVRAQRELERCCYWSAWDPVWGREERLWQELERVWC